MEAKFLMPGDGRKLNVLGDNQTVRLTGKDTGGLFSLVEQTNPPGVGIPLHLHKNEDELFHIIEGSMEFKVGGETTVATAGTTVFLPRNVPHEFMTVGDVPVKTMVMVFPSGAEEMFEELHALPPGPPDMPRVLGICERFGVIFL
ncbi:MAG TPA: cupin domain-containing protein [Abditibacteriaceae bacterium]|jgi:quercetin dioxygenase-like cupin family protein